MKKLALSLLLASITSLSAADMTTQATTSTPKSNFGGYYAGIQTGLAQNTTTTIDNDSSFFGSHTKTESSKASIGLRIGQDFVEESQIYGYFVEGSLAPLDSQKEVYPTEPLFNMGSKINMLGSLQGKYGIVSDKLALFGTAGVAFSDVRHKLVQTSGSACYFNQFGQRIGYVVGFGGAYAIDEKSSFSVDVMQYRLGLQTSTLLQENGTPTTTPSTWGMKDRITTLKISYNIRF